MLKLYENDREYYLSTGLYQVISTKCLLVNKTLKVGDIVRLISTDDSKIPGAHHEPGWVTVCRENEFEHFGIEKSCLKKIS